MVLRLISIHALREEGDHITSTVKYTAAQISIHALREEGDMLQGLTLQRKRQFLSTPSARRATCSDTESSASRNRFLSTPSARRATALLLGRQQGVTISIHALREEGDPARPAEPHDQRISIHALREEGDF